MRGYRYVDCSQVSTGQNATFYLKNKLKEARVWWFMPVTPATPEVAIRRTVIWGQNW
jgi:hypothetical protein